MSQGDLLADRKRLKRGLSTWRVIAIVALFGSLALFAQYYTGKEKPGGVGANYIAQITIDGIIADDEERDELLKEIREDNNAKALLVRFDSPGGTTVGGEELYLQLKEVAKTKPVVGVMRTLCASACYMASLGTDQVFARESTLTGSIGVLLQSVEISRLADKLGITPITIKSGEYKDAPSLTEPLTEDQRAVVNALVMDAYDHFVDMIAARRALSKERVMALADGRVYTGRQAIPLKLVDALGGIDDAKAWLVKEKKVNGDLEIKPMDEEPEYSSLLGHLSQWTGIELFNRSAIGLDGLTSIWHPSAVQ
jgi:protease-4